MIAAIRATKREHIMRSHPDQKGQGSLKGKEISLNWVERSGRYRLWNETHCGMHPPYSPWELLEEKVLALGLLWLLYRAF